MGLSGHDLRDQQATAGGITVSKIYKPPHPPHYEIAQDRDGFYLTYMGHEVGRTTRFASYADAETTRNRWEKEDREAMEID